MTGDGPRFRHGVDLSQQPDTRGELDDWQLFYPGDSMHRLMRHFGLFLVLILMGLGFFTRTRGALPKQNADQLRRVCFQWLLPAFLLRHIWLCQLDSELYLVAAYSFVFHGLWCAASIRTAFALDAGSRQLVGWTMLMSQGTMNSFIYPLLLRHKNFGEKSLACAVLWDIGGNMWICQFALFAIAAHYSPKGAEKELEGDFNGPRGDELDGEENESLLSDKAPATGLVALGVVPLAAFGTDMGELEGKFARTWASVAPCMPTSVLKDAFAQPVLRACILGFVLNLVAAPMPAVVDYILWLVGEPYKMVLYFLVGFYGDHRISSQDLSLLARALGARYACSAAIIGLTIAFMPIAPVYHQTIILVVLSPTSSYLIHLVAEHGYGESLLRLTVCGGFISTIVSTFSQHLLMGFYDPE